MLSVLPRLFANSGFTHYRFAPPSNKVYKFFSDLEPSNIIGNFITDIRLLFIKLQKTKTVVFSFFELKIQPARVSRRFYH